jgi:hypothetical protein
VRNRHHGHVEGAARDHPDYYCQNFADHGTSVAEHSIKLRHSASARRDYALCRFMNQFTLGCLLDTRIRCILADVCSHNDLHNEINTMTFRLLSPQGVAE